MTARQSVARPGRVRKENITQEKAEPRDILKQSYILSVSYESPGPLQTSGRKVSVLRPSASPPLHFISISEKFWVENQRKKKV